MLGTLAAEHTGCIDWGQGVLWMECLMWFLWVLWWLQNDLVSCWLPGEETQSYEKLWEHWNENLHQHVCVRCAGAHGLIRFHAVRVRVLWWLQIDLVSCWFPCEETQSYEKLWEHWNENLHQDVCVRCAGAHGLIRFHAVWVLWWLQNDLVSCWLPGEETQSYEKLWEHWNENLHQHVCVHCAGAHGLIRFHAVRVLWWLQNDLVSCWLPGEETQSYEKLWEHWNENLHQHVCVRCAGAHGLIRFHAVRVRVLWWLQIDLVSCWLPCEETQSYEKLWEHWNENLPPRWIFGVQCIMHKNRMQGRNMFEIFIYTSDQMWMRGCIP